MKNILTLILFLVLGFTQAQVNVTVVEGLAFEELTTAQLNGLISMQKGDVYFNTTIGSHVWWDGDSWEIWGGNGVGGNVTHPFSPIQNLSIAAGTGAELDAITFTGNVLTFETDGGGFGTSGGVGSNGSGDNDFVNSITESGGVLNFNIPNQTNPTFNLGNYLDRYDFTIPDTPVIPGTYTNSNITVNSKGQITSASNGSTSSETLQTIGGVLNGSKIQDGSITSDKLQNISFPEIGGSYTSPSSISINNKGQVTSITSGTTQTPIQGTFDPVFASGAPSTGSNTLSANVVNANYIKTGNVVTFHIYLRELSGTVNSSNTYSGLIRVLGLPFNVSFPTQVIAYMNSNGIRRSSIGYIEGGNAITLVNEQSTNNVFNLTFNGNSSDRLYITGTYITN